MSPTIEKTDPRRPEQSQPARNPASPTNRRPDDPGELDRFKESIPLLNYATQQHGYKIAEENPSRGTAKLQKDGETLLLSRDRQSGHSLYWNPNDDRDNGSIIDFVKSRESASLGQVRQKLRAYLGDDGPARDAAATAQMPRPAPTKTAPAPEGLTPEQTRNYYLGEALGLSPKLESRDYLHSRGLTDATIDDRAFTGRVFTATNGPYKNTAFPLYNENGLVNIEQKNTSMGQDVDGNQIKSRFLPVPKDGIWVSKPTEGPGVPVARIVTTETGLDAMSKHQLDKAAGVVPNTIYIATGGNVTERQNQLIQLQIDKHQPRQVVLGDDNDAAGRRFNINYLNDLQKPRTPTFTASAVVAGGLTEYEQTQPANSFHASAHGKFHTNLRVELNHTTAAEGRGQREGLAQRVAELNGGDAHRDHPPLRLETLRHSSQQSVLVISAPNADTPALELLARELHRDREQKLPAVERQPESFIKIEYAQAKDWTRDVELRAQGLTPEQAQAQAQVEAQTRAEQNRVKQEEAERVAADKRQTDQVAAEAAAAERERVAREETEKRRQAEEQAEKERRANDPAEVRRWQEEDRQLGQAIMTMAVAEQTNQAGSSGQEPRTGGALSSDFAGLSAGQTLVVEGEQRDQERRTTEKNRENQEQVERERLANDPAEIKRREQEDKLLNTIMGGGAALEVAVGAGVLLTAAEAQPTQHHQVELSVGAGAPEEQRAGLARLAAELEARGVSLEPLDSGRDGSVRLVANYRLDQPELPAIHELLQAISTTNPGVQVYQAPEQEQAREVAINGSASLSQAERPGQAEQGAPEASPRAGVLVVMGAPGVDIDERGQEQPSYAQQIRDTLVARGAAVEFGLGVMEEKTGLQHQTLNYSYQEDSPRLAALSATLDGLAKEPGVRLDEPAAQVEVRQQVAAGAELPAEASSLPVRNRELHEAAVLVYDTQPENGLASELRRNGATVTAVPTADERAQGEAMLVTYPVNSREGATEWTAATLKVMASIGALQREEGRTPTQGVLLENRDEATFRGNEAAMLGLSIREVAEVKLEQQDNRGWAAAEKAAEQQERAQTVMGQLRVQEPTGPGNGEYTEKVARALEEQGATVRPEPVVMTRQDEDRGVKDHYVHFAFRADAPEAAGVMKLLNGLDRDAGITVERERNPLGVEARAQTGLGDAWDEVNAAHKARATAAELPQREVPLDTRTITISQTTESPEAQQQLRKALESAGISVGPPSWSDADLAAARAPREAATASVALPVQYLSGVPLEGKISSRDLSEQTAFYNLFKVEVDPHNSNKALLLPAPNADAQLIGSYNSTLGAAYGLSNKTPQPGENFVTVKSPTELERTPDGWRISAMGQVGFSSEQFAPQRAQAKPDMIADPLFLNPHQFTATFRLSDQAAVAALNQLHSPTWPEGVRPIEEVYTNENTARREERQLAGEGKWVEPAEYEKRTVGGAVILQEAGDNPSQTTAYRQQLEAAGAKVGAIHPHQQRDGAPP